MTKTTRTPVVRQPGSALTRIYHGSLMLICLSSPGLTFADWKFEPLLRIAADFDDNATLTSRTDDSDSISGFIGEASVQIVYQSETGQFSIEPLLRSRAYDGDGDRDSDDQFLNFRMRHRGKTSTVGLRGNYARESTRTAELAEADLDADIDPDEIEDDDTGRIGLNQRREKFRLVPQWSSQLSSISKISADVNFLLVDYDKPGNQQIGLVDYNDTRVRLSYERDISARNTAVIVATARNYQTDFLDGDFSGYGLAAGFNRKLSQTTVIRALAGVETTELFDGSDEPEFVADISLVRSQQTTRFLAQYRRRVSASGRGRLVVRNEVNLRFTRDLNDKLAAGIGARAFRTESLTGNSNSSSNNTDYVQLNVQLLWRLSQTFSIQANYRYTVIDRSIVGESANSNRFTLWLSYQPNSRRKIRLTP